MVNDVRFLSLSLAGAVALFAGSSAWAQEFDGWCFIDDVCFGPSPIKSSQFGTCEENCRMDNPVSVRGLNGTLYDVTCEGDTGKFEYRMFLTKFQDPDGKTRVLGVRPDGYELLESCSEVQGAN